MAVAGQFVTSPVVVTYRKTERSKKKLVKILRGKTAVNIEKLMDGKVSGIPDTAVIMHVGVGLRWVPEDKITEGDRNGQLQVEKITEQYVKL